MKIAAKFTKTTWFAKRLIIAAITTCALLNAPQLYAGTSVNSAKQDTSVSSCIKQMIASDKTGPSLYFPESVKRFYQQRNFAPGWVIPQASNQKTWEAMLMLDCVLQFGLAYEDYHPQEILYTRLHDILERPATVGNVAKARYDIILTDAIITFINNLHFGKLNPDYPAKVIDHSTGGFQADLILANALQQKDFMSAVLDVQPKVKEYENLQRRMHLLEGVHQGDCYEIPEAEVRTMAINMERLRWMNVDGKNYIQINIPSFTLKFYRQDTCYNFNITAGKPATPTPVVASSISNFTIGYKPKPARVPTFLSNKENAYQGNNAVNNYAAANAHPGALFFWMVNNKGIVLQGVKKLHTGKNETPANTDGTIKIENGRKLAVLLLENDNAAIRIKEMQAAFNAGVLKNFMLKTPVLLRITYLTCEIKDGLMVTYPDIYSKDRNLEMALYNTSQISTLP